MCSIIKVVGWVGMALAGAGYLHLEASAPPRRSQARPPAVAPATSSPQRALLNRYCVTCHNERAKTAGLLLDTLDVDHVEQHADVWEKVVKKLRAGAMPPANMPRPDKASVDAFVASLEHALDAAAARNPNPGRRTVHRLNRAEYTNAIRDVLALEIDGRSLLPDDESGYGFDNIADVLSVSPGLLDRYMSAAVKISRLAVGDVTLRPGFETYSVSMYFTQHERMSEQLAFGTRGGAAVRHHFPLDAEYAVRVRLKRTRGGEIMGMGEPNDLEVRLDGTKIGAFTIGGKFARGGRGYRAEPQAGADAATSRAEQTEYERYGDKELEVRFPAQAGTHAVGVAFLKRTLAVEGMGPTRLPVASASLSADGDAEMGVDLVQIGGPFAATGPGESESRRRIFACRPTGRPDEEACATKILTTVARRAYRRPVTEKDVQPLLNFFKLGRRDGDFDAGIQMALRGILVSPHFLFRVEQDAAETASGTIRRVSDLDLASRLSFFLWSSIPDDELLDLATRGALSDRAVLGQQVRRMLADARAQALMANFGGQWLYLRNMRLVTPDPIAFPEFEDDLREALQRETELFLQSQVHEDRSVLELLTANYTFVNERLARHYQIPNIYGSRFRRVTFTDGTRGGLLGQGSILTVTSYPHRTSPVLRGRWLLENLIGSPPPPPPPNVPALKDGAADVKAASVRERMAQHRKNPICASCHAQMDPMGFALENYDAIGRWRTVDEAHAPIDASGTLPDGTTFQGVDEFRQILLNHREEFVTTVTEKLLTYALGRGLESYDAPAVRAITRAAASNDNRWSSLILGIVESAPFQTRRSVQ